MPSRTKIADRSLRSFLMSHIAQIMVYFIFAIVLIIFAVWLGDRFFSPTNLLNVTRQTAMISVMAVAMTFVIASGHIDLSVGSIVALTSLVVALLLKSTNNIFLAVAVGLILGAVIGAANGFCVTILRIPSFLATMGMLSVIKGFAMWTTGTKAVPITNELYNFIFGMGNILGFPMLFVWTILALLGGHFVLHKLPFGKQILAVGGNAVSAKYSGINVNKVIMKVMIISGISASMAGILYSGRLQTARYTFGEGDELSVIAAVILGGTAMSGGTGNIIGAIIGSLLLGVINNGLIIGGLSVSQQMIVRGAIIIFSVALNSLGSKGKARA